MPRTEAEFVVLKDGTRVDLDALQLAWDLEGRGLHLRVNGDRLVIGPKAELSEADDAAIRQHRDALVMLVRYCEEVNA